MSHWDYATPATPFADEVIRALVGSDLRHAYFGKYHLSRDPVFGPLQGRDSAEWNLDNLNFNFYRRKEVSLPKFVEILKKRKGVK